MVLLIIKLNVVISIKFIFGLFFCLLVSIMLIVLIIGFRIITGGEWDYSEESSSIFECGYDNDMDSRIPFSLHFFMIILLFIVFDIEILIIFPSSYMSWLNLFDVVSYYILFILSIIYFSLIYEWREGCLDWI